VTISKFKLKIVLEPCQRCTSGQVDEGWARWRHREDEGQGEELILKQKVAYCFSNF